MKTANTPGPWITSAYDGVPYVRAHLGEDEYVDVAMMCDEGTDIDKEANALLIAAAPDLLAFAQSLFNGDLPQDRAAVLERAAAVIAAATGR